MRTNYTAKERDVNLTRLILFPGYNMVFISYFITNIRFSAECIAKFYENFTVMPLILSMICL